MIADIRHNLEDEKLKSIKEFSIISSKFTSVNHVLESLPNAVARCEMQCKNSYDVTTQMKEDMSQILVRNVKLENNKCDQRAFENYNEQMEKRMIFIENTFD